ncbi:MAG: hypothetical protein HYZ28_08745 [Myxococcales bacterium]|nr:hypothetical protein [Myxococcales bacterium]
MSDRAGTIEELRAAIFASKESRCVADAHASPEEKFAMLEAMQELADELRRARSTLRPRADLPRRRQ